MKSIVFRIVVVLALFCQLLGGYLQAHDPGLSSLNVLLSPSVVEVVTSLSDGDFKSLPQAIQVAWRDGPSTSLLPVNTGIELKVNGISPPLLSRQTTQTANRDWEHSARFSIPTAIHGTHVLSNTIHILSRLPDELPSGHRQVVTVISETGNILRQNLLKRGDPTFAFSWVDASPETPASRSVFDYITLGIHHILTGYDHLLFLGTLLLVCRGVRDGLLFVTVFTVAHSLTLAISTLGLVHLSSSWVEPVIAASIVYTALENLWHRDLTRIRVAVVFVFGLVHGFGFASVLQDLHIGSGFSVIRPLLGFNLGVELGQLGVVALFLPVLLKLQAKPNYARRWMPVGSILCAMVGVYWLITRVLVV